MLMTDLGDYIQKRRKKLGYTQQELAERIKRSKSLISEWETGNQEVPMELIEPLAKALEERSPLTLFELAGHLKDVPGLDIVKDLEHLSPDQLRVARAMLRAMVNSQDQQ
jgi:transcriptional regulator with XRE-family HTH domain